MSKPTDEFPCEITMKVVFRNQPTIKDTIISCLTESETKYSLIEKPSKKSQFISFTLSSYFKSEEHLNKICTLLKSIDGFMMMF